jgi:hypothetical protein
MELSHPPGLVFDWRLNFNSFEVWNQIMNFDIGQTFRGAHLFSLYTKFNEKSWKQVNIIVKKWIEINR